MTKLWPQVLFGVAIGWVVGLLGVTSARNGARAPAPVDVRKSWPGVQVLVAKRDLAAGDVLVQQGTNHAWVNRGSRPCRIAFVLIDAAEP